MSKRIVLLVLAVALAGVGASLAWAVAGGGSAWGMGSGMMSGRSGGASGSPVSSITDARGKAQGFADGLGLRTSEVMQFERNFYVKLVDGQGNAATEGLVDSKTGFVSLEYGPAMMWNTRYGMMTGGRMAGAMMGGSNMGGSSMMGGSIMMGPGSMMPSGGVPKSGAVMGGGGMMGGGMMGAVGGFGLGPMMGGAAGGRMGPVSPAEPVAGSVSIGAARSLAQQYLDAKRPGVKVESGGDAFPGYFTFETLRDGKITGMISVNATHGAVWSHWWHGAFVAMAA